VPTRGYRLFAPVVEASSALSRSGLRHRRLRLVVGAITLMHSASISPDGKYLAYCDRTGIHVQVIDMGETQMLADTRGLEILGWSDDGTKIRPREMGA
jgi:WD40-like Beta Propeller Repeat